MKTILLRLPDNQHQTVHLDSDASALIMGPSHCSEIKKNIDHLVASGGKVFFYHKVSTQVKDAIKSQCTKKHLLDLAHLRVFIQKSHDQISILICHKGYLYICGYGQRTHDSRDYAQYLTKNIGKLIKTLTQPKDLDVEKTAPSKPKQDQPESNEMITSVDSDVNELISQKQKQKKMRKRVITLADSEKIVQSIEAITATKIQTIFRRKLEEKAKKQEAINTSRSEKMLLPPSDAKSALLFHEEACQKDPNYQMRYDAKRQTFIIYYTHGKIRESNPISWRFRDILDYFNALSNREVDVFKHIIPLLKTFPKSLDIIAKASLELSSEEDMIIVLQAINQYDGENDSTAMHCLNQVLEKTPSTKALNHLWPVLLRYFKVSAFIDQYSEVQLHQLLSSTPPSFFEQEQISLKMIKWFSSSVFEPILIDKILEMLRKYEEDNVTLNSLSTIFLNTVLRCASEKMDKKLLSKIRIITTFSTKEEEKLKFEDHSKSAAKAPDTKPPSPPSKSSSKKKKKKTKLDQRSSKDRLLWELSQRNLIAGIWSNGQFIRDASSTAGVSFSGQSKDPRVGLIRGMIDGSLPDLELQTNEMTSELESINQLQPLHVDIHKSLSCTSLQPLDIQWFYLPSEDAYVGQCDNPISNEIFKQLRAHATDETIQIDAIIDLFKVVPTVLTNVPEKMRPKNMKWILRQISHMISNELQHVDPSDYDIALKLPEMANIKQRLQSYFFYIGYMLQPSIINSTYHYYNIIALSNSLHEANPSSIRVEHDEKMALYLKPKVSMSVKKQISDIVQSLYLYQTEGNVKDMVDFTIPFSLKEITSDDIKEANKALGILSIVRSPTSDQGEKCYRLNISVSKYYLGKHFLNSTKDYGSKVLDLCRPRLYWYLMFRTFPQIRFNHGLMTFNTRLDQSHANFFIMLAGHVPTIQIHDYVSFKLFDTNHRRIFIRQKLLQSINNWLEVLDTTVNSTSSSMSIILKHLIGVHKWMWTTNLIQIFQNLIPTMYQTTLLILDNHAIPRKYIRQIEKAAKLFQYATNHATSRFQEISIQMGRQNAEISHASILPASHDEICHSKQPSKGISLMSQWLKEKDKKILKQVSKTSQLRQIDRNLFDKQYQSIFHQPLTVEIPVDKQKQDHPILSTPFQIANTILGGQQLDCDILFFQHKSTTTSSHKPAGALSK